MPGGADVHKGPTQDFDKVQPQSQSQNSVPKSFSTEIATSSTLICKTKMVTTSTDLGRVFLIQGCRTHQREEDFGMAMVETTCMLQS